METRPVFVAVLTTGPSPDEDRVIEVAAVRMLDDGATEEMSQLAAGGPIPAAVRDLSGLSERDLAGRPQPKSALRKLVRFSDGHTVIAHSAALVRAFLSAQRIRPPEIIDIRDLARIAVPTAREYSLGGIADAAGVSDDGDHRALPTARLLLHLWRALLQRIEGLPPRVLDVLCRLVSAAQHPLGPALSKAATRGGAFDLSADVTQELRGLFKDNQELLKRVQSAEPEEPTDSPLPTEGVCRMFSQDGLIAKRLARYEYRQEQTEMVEAVCEALNGPRHLVVEAGTGTGKSLAYLVPAIAWTCINGDKVLISTNTKNLQEQLYHKDLPFLSELLPGRFEAAMLKGRRNYLCVRRFLHLLANFDRELAEPDEFMALAALLVWAGETETGDMAECNGFALSPAAPAVARWVLTGPDECLGRACGARRRCFVQRARALAQLADVIVVNHALLFSEIGLDTPVLPPYRCVVFDEAHNLEDVASDILGIAVDAASVYRITNMLHRPRRDGSSSGLLATVMHEVRRLLPAGAADKVTSLVGLSGNAMSGVEETLREARQFFEVLREPFEELPPYVERIPLEECQPSVGPGSAAADAADALQETVRILGERIEELAQGLEGAHEMESVSEELASDLRSQGTRLRELAAAVQSVLGQEDDTHVYWLERTSREGRTHCTLRAAPLQIGQYMREFFFRAKRCVILTSATLHVDGSFDYMLERLGADGMPAEQLGCLALGSPFDYDRQSMVGVTTFLPDPGGQRPQLYDMELSSFLLDLLQCTRGRALVLFTSYSLLDAVYQTVKEPLERSGIAVLAQGHSGSREAITNLFRSVTSSVLLGTRSFWEGVDISGETLSCLVLTKLPFHVFTDPLVRGRANYMRMLGRDAFIHYTLPEAVISFRQGFGRLIRTKSDRGIVVVTDRRLATKAYGRTFLRSLPTRHSVLESRATALEAVTRFFGQE